MSRDSKLVENSEFVKGNVQNFIIDSPAVRWFNWLEQSNLEKWSTMITLLFGIYVRWAVGLNPYSGKF